MFPLLSIRAPAAPGTSGDGAAALVADFDGDPLTGTDPLEVTFTDASTTGSAITSWSWEKKLDAGAWVPFADTPSAQNPVESFTEGTWSVRLTVTTTTESTTKTEADYIVVDPAP